MVGFPGFWVFRGVGTLGRQRFLPSMLLAWTLKPSSLVISKRRCGWFMYVLFLCLGAGESSSELKPAHDRGTTNNLVILCKVRLCKQKKLLFCSSITVTSI